MKPSKRQHRESGASILDHLKSMARRVSRHTPGQDHVPGCQLKSKDDAQTVASLHGLHIAGISRGIRSTSHIRARLLTQKRPPRVHHH